MRNRRMLALMAALAMVMTLAPTASAIEPDQRVDLKVLVITHDLAQPSFQAWTESLQREGVPYDVFDGSVALVPGDLEAGPAHARYQAVVCVTECSMALDIVEMPILDAFQTKYGIRRISGYVFPNALYGMSQEVDTVGVLDMSDQAAALTTYGLTVFPYLNGPVAFGIDTFGWLQEPTADPNLTTLMTGPVHNGSPSTLMGVYDRGGFEDLFLTVDSNPFQIQTHLLYRGLINWVTGGTYLGYGRNYFTMHIDDVFLPDSRWDTVNNCTPDDDCPDTVALNDPIRMTADDVTRAMEWQTQTGLVFDFVYNGAGSVQAGGPLADPLSVALLANKNAFRWINHTYTHDNLDEVDQAKIVYEITENIEWAKLATVGLFPLLDVTELVTGQHSGLRDPFRSFDGNPEMAPALETTGIKWIGSDNSRTPEQEAVGPALTVPRYPANVFYNTATQDEQLDEYNWIYYDNCDPLNPPPATTCLSAPLTWPQYVDVEASIMLPHLLINDARPHYFHQSNLAEQGILYTVVDEVLDRYETYFNVALVQPKFSESGRIIQRADAWASNQDLITAYLFNGSLVIENQGTAPIDVPVTGDGGDTYGGVTSEWRTIAPSSVTPAPTVVVSGPGTAVVGETASFTVDTTGGSVPFTVTPSCDSGTLGASTFDVATGDGTFECTFGTSGSATVTASVNTPAGVGAGSLAVTVLATTPEPPVVVVSGPGTSVSGETGTYTVDTTGGLGPFSLEAACGSLGTVGTTGIDSATGDGSFECAFSGAGSSNVSAVVSTPTGNGTGTLTVLVALPPGGGSGGGTGGGGETGGGDGDETEVLGITNRFIDDDGNLHEPNIEAIAALGITIGCNPPVGNMFCPAADVTRAEMAAFIVRALNETENIGAYQGYFPDVPADSWYAGYVERLFELGITIGNADGTYSPHGSTTRAEMAAFLERAFITSPAQLLTPAVFADVTGDAWYHESLQQIYAAGITTGCSADPLAYCPHDPVRRDAMASFVARALGLEN